MENNTRQTIFGNENIQVGRDFNQYQILDNPIRFNEADLKNLITIFGDNLVDLEKKMKSVKKSLDYPGIDRKNEINNLSDRYFKHIRKQSMSYFKKIDIFLESPGNKSLRKKYFEISDEMNNIVFCHRSYFNYYEEVFSRLYFFLIDNNINDITFEKKLVFVFLHYMYCNCDLGETDD